MINLILVPILAHSQAVRADPVEAQVLKAVAALRVAHNRVAVTDQAAERTVLALRVAAVPRVAPLLTLAAVLLALFTLAPLARMTRAAMLQALASEYLRTARAAGLSSTKVLIVYAFRNAMLPVVTTLGMVFSFLLGANVLVEKVFAWPGVGSYAVEALLASDYAPIQGFVLTMAILYVVLNLLIDILYGVIDPRVRMEG